MLTFEDFTTGQITEFGDYLVTEEEIIEFATKYDPQPFHTDPKFAAKSFHGKLIGSGWMTTAIMMRMLCDNALTNSSSIGSPGVDNLRWIKPVYAGDRLRVHCEILSARESKTRPGVGIVVQKVAVLNQNDEAVMTLQPTSMYLTRIAAAQQQK
ncbi:MaoC family dehydratase [Paremcibacter congregatus]|uniref:MaoC family dehydratase n=1 Tax=Paremcibacter congregatus TaxID=2043170 RepID=UPI0030EDDC33|tara:strand:- start:577 stop:1038 length:462 start_codon:yes stop_codon:yes gene_type:complete